MPDAALEPSVIPRLLGQVPAALALLAGMELRVFTAIGDGSATAQEVASALGLDAGRLSRLLYALVASGVLRVEKGRFSNTAEGALALVDGRPGFLGDAHELYAMLWRADLNTAGSIRAGVPLAEHDFREADPEEAIAFMRGSMASALAFGKALVGQFDLSACRSVIDIGGGGGGVLLGLGEARPGLARTLFDLPSVLDHAATLLATLVPPGTLVLEPGDITQAPPRGRHDAAILRAVVQVLSREEARRAIAHAAAALAPGGRLFISGWGILNDDRIGPRNGVFVNLTFLNLYRAGEAYTEAEYRAWMQEAGLSGIERTQLPDETEVIWGTRPAT